MCMFIRARLHNRVSFVVLHGYIFNLRKQLKDFSAVAVETGIVRIKYRKDGVNVWEQA